MPFPDIGYVKRKVFYFIIVWCLFTYKNMGRKPQKSVGRYCAVRSCSSKGKGCSFFSFPKDDRLLKWIENCKRHDMLKKDLASLWKTYYVCGKHFERRMFLNNLQNRLHSHAIPTLLLTATKPSSKQVETNDISTNTREDSIETLESSNTTRVPLDLNASEPLFNVVRSSDIQLDSQESSFQHIVISEPGPSDGKLTFENFINNVLACAVKPITSG
ncbi:hypothetical protein Trydic_g20003 [Trypoxylus dichotomus]